MRLIRFHAGSIASSTCPTMTSSSGSHSVYDRTGLPSTAISPPRPAGSAGYGPVQTVFTTLLCVSGRVILEVHSDEMGFSMEPQDLDRLVSEHTTAWLDPPTLFDLRGRLARDGFALVSDIVPAGLKTEVRAEVVRLLDEHAERRDLLLKTTGGTPRFMSVVR